MRTSAKSCRPLCFARAFHVRSWDVVMKRPPYQCILHSQPTTCIVSHVERCSSPMNSHMDLKSTSPIPTLPRTLHKVPKPLESRSTVVSSSCKKGVEVVYLLHRKLRDPYTKYCIRTAGQATRRPRLGVFQPARVPIDSLSCWGFSISGHRPSRTASHPSPLSEDWAAKRRLGRKGRHLHPRPTEEVFHQNDRQATRTGKLQQARSS